MSGTARKALFEFGCLEGGGGKDDVSARQEVGLWGRLDVGSIGLTWMVRLAD